MICTGNQIRSPAVEGFVRRFATGLPITVTSAGTVHCEASSASPAAVEAAARLGLDLSDHQPRHFLEIAALEEVNLVLGFERGHVGRVVVDGGARIDRAFTLPELVRLLEALAPSGDGTAAGARAVVERASEVRGGQLGWVMEEIMDPIGQRSKYVRETVATLRSLSLRLVNGLFGRTYGV